MPVVCHVVPNRSKPRTWSARAVGRVYCTALKEGVPEAELKAAIESCDDRNRRRPKAEAAVAMEAAILALEQTDAVFDAEQTALDRMLKLLNILSLVARFIRVIPHAGAKVAAGGVIVVKELAESRLKTIVAQKAANDAALVLLRRAAANEAQFLRVVGL